MTTIATTTPSTTVTARRLLTAGIVAGPFFSVVVAAQALTRDAFDIRKHAASMLTVGDHGWIQIANFIVTGLLVIAGATALRRSSGNRWAGRLLTVYGVSLIAAGLFVPDPALGFPAGTPEGQPVTMSWHGGLHFVAGSVGFTGFVIACFVLARRFARQGERGWAAYSIVTGVFFLAAFAGIASGSAGGPVLAFYAAVALSWTWISLVLRKFQRSA
ncbi:DUF998 domain-containing protein [Kribbella catacumbae]|uniref:DUF998 domain-containing protein n=1 Tax=Kribbella catacumbae TaxID=460086 RepID=UPI0003806E30|nr:DUF998 domain-containing protein [Kribbella catacumbae]